jgi:deoxyribodipyrimidine photolyase
MRGISVRICLLGGAAPRRLRYEKERVSNKSTYWLFFELLWRDYFKFVGLKYGNSIFHLEGISEKVPFFDTEPGL